MNGVILSTHQSVEEVKALPFVKGVELIKELPITVQYKIDPVLSRNLLDERTKIIHSVMWVSSDVSDEEAYKFYRALVGDTTIACPINGKLNNIFYEVVCSDEALLIDDLNYINPFQPHALFEAGSLYEKSFRISGPIVICGLSESGEDFRLLLEEEREALLKSSVLRIL